MNAAALLIRTVLLLALLTQAAWAAHTNYVATVTYTNLNLGTTNGDTIAVNGSVKTYTNNVSSSPSTLIARTNSVGWSATNTLIQLATYAVPGTDTIEAFSTNAIKITSVMNSNLTVVLSAGLGTVSYDTQIWDRLLSAYLPYQLIPGPAGRTNAVSLMVQAIGANIATSSVPADAPGFSNHVNRTAAQSVTGAKAFSGANSHTNPAQVWSGGQIYLLTALTGTNFGLTNGVLVGFLADGFRGTNITGLAGAVHQLIGGQWTNGTLWTPTLYNALASNLTIFGGVLTGSVVYLTGDAAASYLVMRSQASSASVSPAIVAHREKGVGTAVSSNTVLLHLIATGYGTTTDKSAGRIKFYAAETFTDSTSAGSMAFEVTPPGSTTTAEQFRIDSSGAGFSNNLAIAGRLTSGSTSNSTFTGTNKWEGDVSYPPGGLTTIANGHNTINVGTNVWVDLTGSPSGAWQLGAMHQSSQIPRNGLFVHVRNGTGQPAEIVHNSGTEATADYRITTPTATNVLFSSGATATFAYRSSSARWMLMNMYYASPSVLSASSSIDFPSITGLASYTTNITLTGASTNDWVDLTYPPFVLSSGTSCTNVVFQAWPSNDTVFVRCINAHSAQTADPAAGSFRVRVVRY